MIITMKSENLNSIMDFEEIVITDDAIFIVFTGHRISIRHNMNKDTLLGILLDTEKPILCVTEIDNAYILVEVSECVRINSGKETKPEG